MFGATISDLGEGDVKGYLADLRISRKLMVAPCVFVFFLILLAWASYAGYPSTVIFSIIGAAMCASLAANAVMAGLITSTMKKAVEAIGQVSTGDLTREMEITSRDEIGEMGGRFNAFVDNAATISL